MIGITDNERVAQLVPIEELAERLPALQKILADDPDAVVAITKHGKPLMALLPWDSWEDTEDQAAMMETLEIMADPNAMAAIRQSQASPDLSHYIPEEVVLQQLRDKGLIDGDQI